MVEQTFTFSQTFLEAYARLPITIRRKVDRQLVALRRDITHPGLRVRKMADKRGVWEGRVDLRYRFTFERQQGVIRLRSVGLHDIYNFP